VAQPTRPVAELLDFTGGLNSAEPPDQLMPGQLAEIRNLEYRRSRGLKRRRGMVARLTGTIGIGGGFSILSLFRHTPGQSESTMELWAAHSDPGVLNALGRVAAGSVWASVALADPIASTTAAWFCRGVSFNGKLFLPYDSAVDRLQGTAGFGEWQDPAFLESIAPRAARVTVADGQLTAVTPRLIVR